MEVCFVKYIFSRKAQFSGCAIGPCIFAAWINLFPPGLVHLEKNHRINNSVIESGVVEINLFMFAQTFKYIRMQ